MSKTLLRIAERVRECKSLEKVRHFSCGSHVLKNGLSPYLLDLMRGGYVSSLAFNGSALIHDFEIAEAGATSEDVDSAIGEGKFGLARETAEFLNEAIREGVNQGRGIGESVGIAILRKSKHPQDSILAEANKLNIPVSVHVAPGTDIIHIHPTFDPSLCGIGTHRDFLLFASMVANLEGGIYFNIGSAVFLPEIFLKALSLVRNLGHQVDSFSAVNFDFIRHYRPRRNVLERPTQQGGEALEIIGPHELILPLLHAAIITE